MSDDAVVAETVDDSVDAITQVIDDQEFEIDANTDDMGRRAYGRALGSRIGREVGGVVGRGLGQLIVTSARERDDSRAVLGDVRRFLGTVSGEVLRNAAVEASFSEVREAITAAAPTDVLDEVSDETSGAVDEATEEAAGDDPGRSAADLSALREETLRELLDVMSYRELQSVAKEIDVKANLDEETMKERIAETFTEEIDEDAADDSDE